MSPDSYVFFLSSVSCPMSLDSCISSYLLTHVSCPMSHVFHPCLLFRVICPMFFVLCFLSYVFWPLSFVLCLPSSVSGLLIPVFAPIVCLMFSVSYRESRVPCPMFSVSLSLTLYVSLSYFTYGKSVFNKIAFDSTKKVNNQLLILLYLTKYLENLSVCTPAKNIQVILFSPSPRASHYTLIPNVVLSIILLFTQSGSLNSLAIIITIETDRSSLVIFLCVYISLMKFGSRGQRCDVYILLYVYICICVKPSR